MSDAPVEKPRRRGRPTDLDRVLPSGQTIEERILELVRAGATYTAAAQSTGVAPDTFKNWRSEDRYPGERYSTFRIALKAAEGEQRMACELSIARAHRGIPVRTVKRSRKPMREGQRIVRDEVGAILYEETEEVTETVKVHWQAASWWLERRQESREEFPRPAGALYESTKAAQEAAARAEAPVEDLDAALDSAWAAYNQGRADAVVFVEVEETPARVDGAS